MSESLDDSVSSGRFTVFSHLLCIILCWDYLAHYKGKKTFSTGIILSLFIKDVTFLGENICTYVLQNIKKNPLKCVEMWPFTNYVIHLGEGDVWFCATRHENAIQNCVTQGDGGVEYLWMKIVNVTLFYITE